MKASDWGVRLSDGGLPRGASDCLTVGCQGGCQTVGRWSGQGASDCRTVVRTGGVRLSDSGLAGGVRLSDGGQDRGVRLSDGGQDRGRQTCLTVPT